jgi:hypothetical protein
MLRVRSQVQQLYRRRGPPHAMDCFRTSPNDTAILDSDCQYSLLDTERWTDNILHS